MTINNLSMWFVGIEFAITIAFYFSLYNPIKKKESMLIREDRLTKIKKYLLKNIIRETKPLMILIFSIFVISALFLLSSSNEKIATTCNIVILIGFMISVIASGLLFLAYITTYRSQESISEATNIKQILKILKVKGKYKTKIEKMINITWKNSERENWLLCWILDYLTYHDKRIKTK